MARRRAGACILPQRPALKERSPPTNPKLGMFFLSFSGPESSGAGFATRRGVQKGGEGGGMGSTAAAAAAAALAVLAVLELVLLAPVTLLLLLPVVAAVPRGPSRPN